MNDFDGLQLIRAVEALNQSVKESTDSICASLQSLDHSLTLLVKETPDEQLPTAGELVKKLSDLGAKAVMNSIRAWEKKNWDPSV